MGKFKTKVDRPLLIDNRPGKSIKFKDCISAIKISSQDKMAKDEKFHHSLLVEWFLKWN